MTDPAASQTGAKPARRGGRPSLAAAGEIEGQIVDVARDLFFAHGYGATSVETIARHARISKRTFYHRFPNKAAIFAAVVNRLIQDVSPPDVGGLFEGKPCEDILRGLAGILLQASLTPRTLALQRLILAEATRFPELALVMSEQGTRRYAIQRIAEILERETHEGRLRVDQPVLTAELFMNMVIGIPQRRALGLGKAMSPEELQSWARLAVHTFLHGCRQP